MNISLCLPFNSTSFGNVGTAIAREFYWRGISPNIFPIGGVDLSAQKEDKDFNLFLQSCINKAPKLHDRNNLGMKAWHISDCQSSYTRQTSLLTFHETDQLTEVECNALKNQDTIFVTSKYTKKIFEDYTGHKNVIFAPLGWDDHNFRKITNKEYLGKDVITFNLTGKMEKRKNTLRLISLWAAKFGNQSAYRLNCLCFNMFVEPGKQEFLINEALAGKRYWNIKFLPFLKTLGEVVDYQNSADIEISGLSGCEGFSIPTYNAIALGKICPVLNASVFPDYANDKNAVMVQPSKMTPADDGQFFIPGSPYNNGNWFDFENEAAIAAMEECVKRAKTPNPEGEKLRNQTYKQTVDIILENLQKL